MHKLWKIANYAGNFFPPTHGPRLLCVALFKALNFDERRILNCKLESLSSRVFVFATKFASKCHIDSNSIIEVFLSGDLMPACIHIRVHKNF